MSIRTLWALAETIERVISDEIYARVQELAPDDDTFDDFRPLYLSAIRDLMEDDGFISDTVDSVVPVYTYDIFTLAAASVEIVQAADASMEYYDTIESALTAGIYATAFQIASDHLASLEERYTD